MSNYMIFAMLLVPSPGSLLPTLPALGIMLTLVLTIGLYGFGIRNNPTKAFENLGMGSKVAIAVGAQILLLVGFAAKYELVLAHSQPITLKIATRDPFDLFRGNYLAFNYDISQLRYNQVAFRTAKPLYQGEVVWVTLTQGNPAWQPVSLSDELPVCANGQVALKGIVSFLGNGYVSLHYGLEQFFFPDGKKLSITSNALATVNVNSDGEAILIDLKPL